MFFKIRSLKLEIVSLFLILTLHDEQKNVIIYFCPTPHFGPWLPIFFITDETWNIFWKNDTRLFAHFWDLSLIPLHIDLTKTPFLNCQSCSLATSQKANYLPIPIYLSYMYVTLWFGVRVGWSPETNPSRCSDIQNFEGITNNCYLKL